MKRLSLVFVLLLFFENGVHAQSYQSGSQVILGGVSIGTGFQTGTTSSGQLKFIGY